ncbi:MAG: riboflavin biosynthesis protein RibD [Verrucomicrobiales bacterium]|nr:riboflavin biosynthesis protein RibD [Verrucomicrobiales bacterium]
MISHSPEDEKWMREALTEGEKGLGLTSPNPAVGSVIVHDGQLIGKGWHHKAGTAHAEVNAIFDAQETHGPNSTKGATIYVTLEPCSTFGKTPPCVEAIKEAGLARVVVGTTDPNKAHAGHGFDLLRSAGIEVETDVLKSECDHLIRFFSKHITTGMPWVIAKSAATLDGRTILPPEHGQWISCEASREDVQAWRRQCDAILIGGETLRKDNPLLTLRGKWAEGREQPLRVVVTEHTPLPGSYHLLNDEFSDRTRIHKGVSLEESLRSLGEQGVSSVLMESGGRLLAHALESKLVDEVVLYLAPILGGGPKSLIPVQKIAAELKGIEVTKIDRDIRVVGRVA